MEKILKFVSQRPDCKIVWRERIEHSKSSSDPKRSLPSKAEQVPEEIVEFRNLVSSMELFGDRADESSQNSWILRNTDHWLNDSINEMLVGSDEDGHPYLRDVYFLGNCKAGGLIGVDTHPARLGWIGFYWDAGDLWGADFPVIAHSFSDWLQRVIDAGPGAWYWRREGYMDLGMAIPEE